MPNCHNRTDIFLEPNRPSLKEPKLWYLTPKEPTHLATLAPKPEVQRFGLRHNPASQPPFFGDGHNARRVDRISLFLSPDRFVSCIVNAESCSATRFYFGALSATQKAPQPGRTAAAAASCRGGEALLYIPFCGIKPPFTMVHFSRLNDSLDGRAGSKTSSEEREERRMRMIYY